MSQENLPSINNYLKNGLTPRAETEVEDLFRRLCRLPPDLFGLADWQLKFFKFSFPDCIASKGKDEIRIEFEFLSRNFQDHGHDPEGCDIIVCWRDNWGEEAPAGLEIIELRQLFSFPRKIWFQPFKGKSILDIGEFSPDDGWRWSVPPSANEGDLLLAYLADPHSLVRYLFVLDGPVERMKAGRKSGYDYLAEIRRLCTLAKPIHWRELKTHFRNAQFVKMQMNGRFAATPYWPLLYQMIISRNPDCEDALKLFSPD